jgi:hypothetical protein
LSGEVGLTLSNRYRLIVDYDPEEGCHLEYFRVPESPEGIPPAVALTIGDLIHNARGALDHVAWQLARSTLKRDPTESEARSIQFPIVLKPEHFANQAVIQYISEPAAEEILRQQPCPPYERGDPAKSPLALLRFLSVRDKHRVILATVPNIGIYQTSVVTDPPDVRLRSENVPPQEGVNFRGNPRLLLLRRHYVLPPAQAEDTQIDVYLQSPVGISIGGPVDNVYVPDLEAVIQRVERVVRRFERFFD